MSNRYTIDELKAKFPFPGAARLATKVTRKNRNQKGLVMHISQGELAKRVPCSKSLIVKCEANGTYPTVPAVAESYLKALRLLIPKANK